MPRIKDSPEVRGRGRISGGCVGGPAIRSEGFFPGQDQVSLWAGGWRLERDCWCGWWLVGRPSEPRPPVCYLLEGLACC